MKRTILFTIDDYHIGGVTEFVKQYATALNKLNGRSIILGLEGNLSNPKKYFENSEKVIVIPQRLNSSFWGRIKSYFIYKSYLNEVLTNFEVDIIHFGTTWSTLYALTDPRVWFKKKVITFYGAYHLENKSTFVFKNLIKYSLYKLLQRISLLFSNKIITFSKYSKGIIFKEFGKKVASKVIIVPGAIKAQKRTLNYFDSKEFTLVNFGRAEPRKGIDLLLNAVKLLKDKGYKIILYIASPVDYLKWFDLLNLYEDLNLFDTVHFLHKVNLDQKKKLLEKADLFVVPSKDLETFGMTVLESLSAGVPVVVTPVGAMPSILNKIEPRLITSGVNTKSLVKTIEWFFNLEHKQKKEISKKCSEVVKKDYSFDKLETSLKDVYFDEIAR